MTIEKDIPSDHKIVTANTYTNRDTHRDRYKDTRDRHIGKQNN